MGNDKNLNFGFDDKHLTDKQWIVKFLGHISPSDEIFDKDYFPPPLKKMKKEPNNIAIPQNFLKGLPIKPQTKSRSRVRLQITKNAVSNIKELRIKEKKDSLRIEMEMERQKKLQQSPSR